MIEIMRGCYFDEAQENKVCGQLRFDQSVSSGGLSPRTVGLPKTYELFYSGELLNAEEALPELPWPGQRSTS